MNRGRLAAAKLDIKLRQFRVAMPSGALVIDHPGDYPYRAMTTVSRAATLLETRVDDDIVALDVDQGLCFGFNATAARIWELIEAPQTVGSLVNALSGEFDVDPAICAREVDILLDQLVSQGLVRRSN